MSDSSSSCFPASGTFARIGRRSWACGIRKLSVGVNAWRGEARGVLAEMHAYEVGGHGFGMFRENRPADKWLEQLEPWLKGRGIVP